MNGFGERDLRAIVYLFHSIVLPKKHKNDTFFNEIDDLEKSRQVWKVFLVFRAENVLFLCCGKARETKENVFNEVVYIFRGFSGFPKAQKQHI